MRSIRCLALAILLCAGLYQRAGAQELPAKAVVLPKPATAVTKEKNAAVLKELPFQNREDFAEAQRGLVAPIDPPIIRGASGLPIWDLSAYSRFVNLDTPAPDTVNPSLWRQLQLLTIAGLFKVTDRVYQVRGYDLSNISIIEGDTGLVIIDPLISEQTARASLDLYFKHRPRKPVVAVIFTHSHVDHYAGVAGIVPPEDLAAGRVKIIAPEGFLDEAVSENVIAGNAMGRRAGYMYGALLPKGPKGQVSAGLGLTTSLGTKSLLDPTDTITETGQEMTVDGVRIRFQLTPGTEAPAEMNFYFPDLKALCMAENLAATFHNVLTLRGAKVRDPLQWSKYLQQAIDLFGGETEVVFTSHHWPKWGKAEILNYMSKQRDLYKFINDQASRLFNQGYTIIELAEMIKLPESLAQEWFNRGYYGTVNHNAKAVYQRYLGWFDGNPAHLHTYPPAEGGKRYVEAIGGPAKVLAKGAEAFKQGDYRWAAELLSHLVFADPDNQPARLLLADALEQLGYQAESGPWRNFYLMGAQELRVGVLKPGGQSAGGVDTEVVESMGVDLLLDYVAIHLNGPRASGKIGRYDFVFTDVAQTWRVNLENAVLQYSPALPGAVAEATLTLTRAALNDVIGGKTTYEQAVQSGAIQVSGDQAAAVELFSLMDLFDPWFNIVTP
ncbi:MAG: linear primary-alkylsulfatase [Acidobacteriota bacterium]|jgi:alkyl sulfatase BDS1-like metallo-beta-lactamase superfamily hydrolase|nr:linear primary-alkylsulfatase [Acidobacteriota bacterium]